jgi:probable HAF family extracellular repeat protein
MKFRFLIFLTTITLFTALAMPVRLAAQDKQSRTNDNKHHHYQLIDMGTFGGPQSGTQDELKVLNSRGMVAGGADTSTPDPNYPNSCIFCGPFIAHGFRFQNGKLTDLGALPGLNTSGANWMGESGSTAGFSEISDAIDPLLGIPEMHAVLWKNSQIIDLGTLEGGYESAAFSVNSHGQVAGVSFNLVPDPIFGTQERTFLWDKDKGMQDLGTLGTGNDAGILPVPPLNKGNVEINERGQVVACSTTNTTINPVTGLPTIDPFLWDKESGMQDLGSFGGTAGCAIDINNSGQVVGYSNLAGDLTFHPFLWVAPGPMQDLGTLGGNFGFAIWANEAGDIVGSATNQGDQAFHGFLWNKGVMTDIGTLNPLPQSFAEWINSREQVVGKATSFDFSTQIAILWENGGPIVDLNTLVPPGSNLQLMEARNINDRGEISGAGTLPNGDGHAFLLIPCDENHPGVSGCEEGSESVGTSPEVTSVGRRPSLSPPANRYHFPGLAIAPRN